MLASAYFDVAIILLINDNNQNEAYFVFLLNKIMVQRTRGFVANLKLRVVNNC